MNNVPQKPPPAAAPNVELVEIVVHLPGGAARFRADQILQWDPLRAGDVLSVQGDDGLIHNFFGAVFETVLRQSSILRVA